MSLAERIMRSFMPPPEAMEPPRPVKPEHAVIVDNRPVERLNAEARERAVAAVAEAVAEMVSQPRAVTADVYMRTCVPCSVKWAASEGSACWSCGAAR